MSIKDMIDARIKRERFTSEDFKPTVRELCRRVVEAEDSISEAKAINDLIGYLE